MLKKEPEMLQLFIDLMSILVKVCFSKMFIIPEKIIILSVVNGSVLNITDTVIASLLDRWMLG